MTVSEQPVSTAATENKDGTAKETPPANSTEEKRRLLRETTIALGVLFVLVTAVLIYFFASRESESAESVKGNAGLSTAEWLKPDNPKKTTGGAPSAAVAPENAVTSAVQEVESPIDDNVVDLGEGVRSGTVESGVPVIKSLQKLGLSIQKAHEVVSALDGVFDFRRSRPGDAFKVKVDDKGEPQYFAYHASLTEVYEVKRKGDGLKGHKKHIPTTHTEKRFGGTIASSLYKSLSDVGAHPSLAGKVADVLSNEVDFFKEQRPGDTFRVIVKEETLDDAFLGYGPILALEYKGVKSGQKRFVRFEKDNRDAEYFSDKGISQPRSVISIPLHYTRISSRFGMRYHPVLKRKKLHNGVDFAASVGTPVWACSDGVVTIAGKKGANGNLVGIDHGEGLHSYYAHLLRFAKGIRSGVKVKQRQVIGYVGNTGRSTGPHLHFGLKKGSKFIDPLKYKVRPGRPIEAKYRKKLNALIRKMGQKLDTTRIAPPSEPLVDVPDADNEVLGLEDW
jgi:murein DD-endopeptidase MepM/ murein hydrolase activator NlpD